MNRMPKIVKNTAGMTLIELIIGLAISSVVSLMAAQFFAMAVRLHRSSTEISYIQREGQQALSQISDALMSAGELYYADNDNSCVLVLGRESGDPVHFRGQIFYYNRKDHKLYADMSYDGNVTADSLFGSLRIQSEIGRIEEPDYLISNKVEDMRLSLSCDLKELESLGNHAYACGEKPITVTAMLTMQYHESRAYDYSASVMPRERLKEVTWNEANRY